MHRRLVYIYLLDVPSFSSHYFNKIKRTSRLGRLLAISLEILCVCIKEDNSCVFTVDEQLGGAKKKIINWVSQFIHICSQGTSNNDCILYTLSIHRWLPFHCQRWRPNRCEFATQVFVGLDISNGKITFNKYS